MHFCKVCNKGFSCGGALGGHMRSHGFEDHINAYRNNDEDNKHTYFLRTTTNEEKDLTNYLVMLSAREEEEKAKEGVKGNFQCKACKKVFNSHQALGGHRASHKRVRGCFAARFENIDDGDDDDGDDDNGFSDLKSSEAFLLIDLNRTSESSKKKQKVHECSICHRVFSSGQALGGHKRCHWLVSNMRPDNYRVPIFHGFPWNSERLFKKPMICKSQSLDLNLPTLFDNRDQDDDEPSKFTRIYLPAARDKEETCREVELPKLREMNLDGKCSTWLQVGIGHPTE